MAVIPDPYTHLMDLYRTARTAWKEYAVIHHKWLIREIDQGEVERANREQRNTFETYRIALFRIDPEIYGGLDRNEIRWRHMVFLSERRKALSHIIQEGTRAEYRYRNMSMRATARATIHPEERLRARMIYTAMQTLAKSIAKLFEDSLDRFGLLRLELWSRSIAEITRNNIRNLTDPQMRVYRLLPYVFPSIYMTPQVGDLGIAIVNRRYILYEGKEYLVGPRSDARFRILNGEVAFLHTLLPEEGYGYSDVATAWIKEGDSNEVVGRSSA